MTSLLRAALTALGMSAAFVATQGFAQQTTQGPLGQLPPITADDLNGRSVSMPQGFSGEVNLLLIAFEREQQADIDTWLAVLGPVAAEEPRFDYYELPTVGRFTAVGRWFLDNAMRSGITSVEQRRRTITIYAPKPELMAGLRLSAEDRIYAILIDRSGAALWRAEGLASPEKLADLRAAIAAALD